MTTKSQETRAQIQTGAAAIGIASRACETYVKRLMDVNAEAMNFVSARLRQDVELGESFARCKSWTDVSNLQQAWGRKAVEDYMSMSKKIMELTSQMADNPWAPRVEGAGGEARMPESPTSESKTSASARRVVKKKPSGAKPKRTATATRASTPKRKTTPGTRRRQKA